MDLKVLVLTIIFTTVIHFITCQSNCWEKKSCGLCIQTRECSWCKMSSYQGPRCGNDRTLEEYNCDKEEIESAPPEFQREEKRAGKLTSSSFSPPEYKVRLRVGDKVNLTAKFSFETKRSLDLYYLLDASCTMQIFREGLNELAGNLTRQLQGVTKDLRLGFGSFVDKPVMPFIRDPQEADHGFSKTCGGKKLEIIGTYGFRNYLALSEDTLKFTQSVNNSHVSGNYDLPEGGLDALLQAAVCKEEIGWRDDTLRIVVLATDDRSFHITGDGKVGGIILPHDGKCHLTSKEGYQEYSMSTEFDYPSIALVNDKVRENRIRVVFATPNTSLSIGVSDGIEGSATVALDKNQSVSIVDVVVQECKKIINTVKLAEEQTDIYRIKLYSKCHPSEEFVAGGQCDFIGEAAQEKRTIEYQIELEVLECPAEDAVSEQTISVGPAGFHSKLTILLTPACSCSCENQQDVDQTKKFCKHGSLICGKCACSEGYCGKKCDRLASGTNHSQCYRNGMECSGRGKCQCGECECETGLLGPVCQFNRTQCPVGDNGRICSGNGSCSVKVKVNEGSDAVDETLGCDCHPGFGGPMCNCKTDTSNCRESSKSPLCSNNGHCVCNKCHCKNGHVGKFCQNCFLTGFQEELSVNPNFRACMDTKFSDESQVFSEESILPCFSKQFEIEPVVRIVDEISDTDCNREMSPCRLEVYRHPKTGCKHQFTVNCNPENVTRVIIQWNQYGNECNGPKDLLGLFVGVASAIVAIGIITLIAWKIATHYHDKQEFLKFEKDRANAQWSTDQNPFYKPSTTMHANPSYGTDEQEFCESQNASQTTHTK